MLKDSYVKKLKMLKILYFAYILPNDYFFWIE